MLNSGGIKPPSSGFVADDKDAMKKLKELQKKDKKKPNIFSKLILEFCKDQLVDK